MLFKTNICLLFPLYIVNFVVHGKPTVNTPLGLIRGHYKQSYEGHIFSAFEGIPYAKPPLGPLRFEEPQNIEPWLGVWNATTIYDCIQLSTLNFQVIGDEDCLYLNIYIPRENPQPNDNLDVVVFIHGGAFMFGNPLLGGPEFLMDRDIVYVNLNYRVGLIGFLSTEDDIIPGNNGMKDQVLALKWIQNNIKSFGGNPQSVTITGLSAGGSAVHFHYFSPLSEGLFHRGISQSGTALVPWALQEAPLEKAKKLAELVGCSDSSTKEIKKCLQNRSARHLVEKTAAFFAWYEYPLAPFAPVIENKSKTAFLTEHPYQLLKKRLVKDLPWITSVTTEEGIFPVITFKDKLDDIDKQWNKAMPFLLDYNYTVSNIRKDEVSQKIRKYYLGEEKLSDSNIHKLIKLFGDRYFVVDFEKAARLQAKVTKSPVYSYMYGYEGEGSISDLFKLNKRYGVAHGEDGYLLYNVKLFGVATTKKKLSISDELIKECLVDMVTSFAKNGKPTIKNVRWEPVANSDQFAFLLFDKDPKEIEMGFAKEVAPTEFWKTLPILENDNINRGRDEL
ncbi:hypothetical protein ILUMI_13618 [Ignelater luminosus]|uniref:Carboxylic ester hydrolase n=1 Tax=Ignelater luminosus TaxID=2038154 RepID=A0A8K0GBS6_IGNLU|nr:hypothetical protein ILUMI_13618 [Ignelater luminosus]